MQGKFTSSSRTTLGRTTQTWDRTLIVRSRFSTRSSSSRTRFPRAQFRPWAKWQGRTCFMKMSKTCLVRTVKFAKWDKPGAKVKWNRKFQSATNFLVSSASWTFPKSNRKYFPSLSLILWMNAIGRKISRSSRRSSNSNRQRRIRLWLTWITPWQLKNSSTWTICLSLLHW